MKLRAVSYDDKEDIEEVTVTMNLKEVLALVAVAGKFNGHALAKLGLVGEKDSLYYCLNSVLEMNFDEDLEDIIPKFGGLEDLNI
jgi:hypothetical protein